MAELTQKQTSILRAAAKLLKPGGRLVYATCSLLPEENEAIVETLLAEGGFALLPVNELLAQNKIDLDTGAMLKLSPAVHGTDGFFAAVLVKAAGLTHSGFAVINAAFLPAGSIV